MSGSLESNNRRRIVPRATPGPCPIAKPGPSTLLIVSGDLDFVSTLVKGSVNCDWAVRHALSFDDASTIMSKEPIAMVVYDSDLSEVPWQLALPRLIAIASDACILLASRVADEYLWQEVVRCNGYDILVKSAGSERIISTLRFAWFWRKRLRSPNDRPKPRATNGERMQT
jgi:hypothetical protein